tara:strand:- start:2708 stop:5146 length:2439 start_codon:yes stop_codon:yes gene_type:complete
MSKTETINLTYEQERAARRAEQTQFMSESFYVQRMDAKAWFTATESATKRVVGKDAVNLKSVQMKAMRGILMAMGATQVEFSLSGVGKKKKAKGQRVTAADYSVSNGPSKVVGTLDYSKARPLVAAIHKALWNKGMYRTISTGDGGIENIPIMTIDEVVDSKIKMDKTIKVKSLPTAPVRVTGATWKKQFKVSWFVASLYSQNVWTLHMLDNLQPTLVPIMGYGNDKGLVDDLNYRLVLPERMVDGRGNLLPKFKHLKGIRGDGWKTALKSADVITKREGGDKNFRPKIKIFLKRGREVVPASLFNISDSGRLNAQFQQGQSEVVLFSKTSKMSAPSFSLPAGNPKAGGTCIMAAKDPETGQEMDLTICNKCYATNNNYTYASSVYNTSVRLGWVNECLDKRNLSSQEGSLADKLTAAIIAYAVLSTDGTYDATKKVTVEQLNPKTGKKEKVKRQVGKLLKNQKGRQTMEIGVWDAAAKKIQTPSGGGRAKRFANSTPILRGEMGGMTYKTTADFFADTIGSEGSGAICGFFRIHDAGDFTVLRQNSYIEAWNQIAASLPHVIFWAPTRVWATNKQTNLTDRKWLRNCLKWGTRLDPMGSRSLRKRLAAGMAGTIRARIANYLIVNTEDDPEECADIIESLVEIEDSGGANTPGESGGRISETGQNNMMVNYVPNPATVNRLRRGAQLDNYTIRPSSLYVKTATNPAFIPSVSGLDAGSGVNKVWSSAAKPGELKKEGIDPKSYIPVFSCDGKQAYQCPVYSKSVVLDAENKPVPLKGKKGEYEMAEAASCQAAGCRACWLWPDIPITYGAH